MKTQYSNTQSVHKTVTFSADVYALAKKNAADKGMSFQRYMQDLIRKDEEEKKTIPMVDEETEKQIGRALEENEKGEYTLLQFLRTSLNLSFQPKKSLP